MTSLKRLGVVGAGKMAGALVKGWVRAGAVQPQQIMVSAPERDIALLEPLKKLGCQTTYNNKDVGAWSDLVMVGVKPGIVPLVAKDLNSTSSDGLFVSIAAGVSVSSLQNCFGEKSRIVRVMPNTAVEVGRGASVYSSGSSVTTEDADKIQTLFSSVGKCWRVAEAQIDAVTGISGSGPAYMYLILEALTEEGVRQGLDPDLSRLLAAQTMQGAGEMAGARHPAILRGEVTSPGGSTAEGIRALEKGGLRYIIMEGVAAAAQKCRQIGAA